MTTLWIVLGCIGALLLLLALVLFLGMAKIRIAVSGERLKLMLSLFGVRIWILPTKKGILKKGKDSKILRSFRDSRKKKKAEKKAKQAAGEPLPNLVENLEMLFVLLKLAHQRLHKKLRLRVHRFYIEVATSDAAQTAILYGSVIGICSCFWEWVQLNLAEVKRKPGEMAVVPNYQKTLGRVEIDMTFKLKGLKALFLVFELIDAYKLESAKAVKKAADRVEKQKAREEAAKNKDQKTDPKAETDSKKDNNSKKETEPQMTPEA